MTIKNMMLLSAAAVSLAACGSKTEPADNSFAVNDTVVTDAPANGGAMAPAPAASGAQAFANAAAASDNFEIESSKAALATSKSAAVKKFAQAMIDAHTGSTAKLKTAAAAAKPAVTPDPTLNPDQEAQLTALKAKTGADFDTAYIAAQTAGHETTLSKLKDYAATGDDASLKAFAQGLVPTVTAHLNMAKGLKP